MKKVALMTWFQHDNYGTVLQSVATTRVVNDMGYYVDGIDYFSKGYNRTTKLEKVLNRQLLVNKIKKSIKYRKYAKRSNLKRTEAFKAFKDKYLNMTKPTQTSSELFLLNKEYDAFICGSDQIWTPKAFNSKYYLDFVAVPEKMVAYAPSFGMSTITDEFIKNRIVEHVKRFKHLSVREEQGAKLLKELCGIEAKVVLDPTLLLSREEWDDYSIKTNINSSYLLCYFLGDNDDYWNHVDMIANKYGLDVVVIPIHTKDYYRGYEIQEGVGPGEFLSLIKNASFVCTDSFHGSIFSVVYQRPFLTYKRFSDNSSDSQNSRIYNLLKLINMQDRIVSSSKFNIDDILMCDFSIAFKVISEESKRSKEYLNNSLLDAFKYPFDENEYKITNTCCGCSVCKNVCKQNAITIEINDKGFYEARINKNKCVKCGLCRKVCAYNGQRGNIIDKDTTPLYMLRSNSSETLTTSTSGGAAFELSKLLSMKGYDVVGCTYDRKSATAIHKKVQSGDIKSLSVFQGSKYIQSNTIEAFRDVLISEKAIIFGTPCQIAGLDNFLRLKKRREDYVLVDLICHGVPSIYLWHKYLKEGFNKYGYGNKPYVHFRYKKMGWKRMYMYIYGNGKKYIKRNSRDMFYRYFELQNCYMPSCYECNYRTSSKADIRIGDYWGKKYDKYKKTGASMVIAITHLGNSILKELKQRDKIELIREECSDYWSVQFPENPIIPLYYDELISKLKDSNLNLNFLIKRYFRIHELNKRLSNIYRQTKKLFH